MSKKNRRTFSGKEKFKIVLEALKGQRQIVEIASEYGVHPNQITNWKKEFLEKGEEIFSKKSDNNGKKQEEFEFELFKKVGQQQIEIDWLKKKLGV